MTRIANKILNSAFVISILVLSGVGAKDIHCWSVQYSWTKECGYRGIIFTGALFGALLLTGFGLYGIVELKRWIGKRRRVTVVEEMAPLSNENISAPDCDIVEMEGNQSAGCSTNPPSRLKKPSAPSISETDDASPDPLPEYTRHTENLPQYSEV